MLLAIEFSPSGGEGGPSCESTKDHGALKQQKVVEKVRKTDGEDEHCASEARLDVHDVLKDNVSDNETQCNAHTQARQV